MKFKNPPVLKLQNLGVSETDITFSLHHICKCTQTHTQPWQTGSKAQRSWTDCPVSVAVTESMSDNFTSAVVDAVEPYELCDHDQMQGNWWSKWVLGERKALRSPPHHSRPNPPVTEHHSMTDAHRYRNMPSVISLAGARTLEMCAVTFSHVCPHFVQPFQTVLASSKWKLCHVKMCFTMQRDLSWQFQKAILFIWHREARQHLKARVSLSSCFYGNHTF